MTTTDQQAWVCDNHSTAQIIHEYRGWRDECARLSLSIPIWYQPNSIDYQWSLRLLTVYAKETEYRLHGELLPDCG